MFSVPFLSRQESPPDHCRAGNQRRRTETNASSRSAEKQHLRQKSLLLVAREMQALLHDAVSFSAFTLSPARRFGRPAHSFYAISI